MSRPYSSILLMMAGLTAFSALAAETPSEAACSFDGVTIGNDIDFNESFKRIAPLAGTARVTCNTVWQADMTVDEMRLRISRASLARDNEDHTPVPASLIRIERLNGGKPHLLGWGVLPDYEQEDSEKLMPQIVRKNGVLLIRIAPRHRHIYSLAGDRFERIPAFEWRGVLNVEPALTKGGQPLSIDLERMEGRVALMPASENPPVGQSTYDIPKIAVAQLNFVDGKLAVLQQKIVERHEGDDAFVDGETDRARSVRAGIKNLPPGVEPCGLGGWSIDMDPKGLNVRAEPGASAKILGVVPPPLVFTEKDKSEFGVGPLHAEFDIIGYRGGWFLIENISAPGVPYEAKYPKKLPQPFKGRGWVSANMVSAQQGNMAEMAGLLFRGPHADAMFDAATDEKDRPYDSGSTPAHIRACTGQWGYIETKSGDRGWTKHLCSNQVTTCG